MIITNSDILVQTPERILKSNVSSDEVKIYELYLQRIQKEYDLIWNRFKIYFGFNSGSLVIIGYILSPYFTENCFNAPDCILWLTFFLGWIGLIFAFAWLSINTNGNKWQDFFNELIKQLEKKLFENLDLAIYHRILKDGVKKRSFLDIDVVHINVAVSIGFVFVWLFVIIFSWFMIFK